MWEEFLKLYGAGMYREFNYHGVDDGPLRDDLLHDLALKLIRNDWAIVRRFLDKEEQVSFKPLLRSIIRSVIFDHFRSESLRRRIELVEGTSGLSSAADRDSASDPAQGYLRQQIVRELLAAARTNRGKTGMQTLYLRYILGYSVKHIAEIMQTSPNTISQRIKYYLAKLGSTGLVNQADE